MQGALLAQSNNIPIMPMPTPAPVDATNTKSQTETDAPQKATSALPLQYTEPSSWQDNLSHILSTLLLLVTIILISAWILRKVMQTRIQQVNQSHLIKIISQRPLSPKTNLYVVQVYNKGIVVAESATGVSVLSEVAIEQEQINAIDPQEQNHVKSSFRTIMDKVLPPKA